MPIRHHRVVLWLRVMLGFIALFHLAAGIGLTFSVAFQQWAVGLYGAQVAGIPANVYFLRIIGSFALVLGFLAAVAARDPLRHQAVILGFVLFFLLRNVQRHLHSDELYAGFGVPPAVNNLTTVFFLLQAIVLAALLWGARKEPRE